jgi:rRNA-processing protein FCF1
LPLQSLGKKLIGKSLVNEPVGAAINFPTKNATAFRTKPSGSSIPAMQKPQLVAVDTNVLMRLADGHEATIDAWQLIKRRLRPVQFLVPPTVLGELASKLQDPRLEVRATARQALREMRGRWQFQPAVFNAVQEAVAANAVRVLRDSGLVPYEERNDAGVIAESAVLNCVLLVSRDSYLLDVDPERLALLFRQLDLPAPIIASPENLLKKFYT